MWINIPSGTCNGNYWIVVTIDPNENFLEYRENNNVIAVPITLTRQATSNPIIEIMADKSGTIAQGETIRLTATAGTAYLWSTGATTQSIEVNTSGTYSVTVTTYCGTVTSAPFNVTVIPNPNDPTVTSATICQGQSATISANASSGTVYWYTQPSGNSLPVGNGPSYTTPTLGGTTTYYAQAEEVTPGPVNFAARPITPSAVAPITLQPELPMWSLPRTPVSCCKVFRSMPALPVTVRSNCTTRMPPWSARLQ